MLVKHCGRELAHDNQPQNNLRNAYNTLKPHVEALMGLRRVWGSKTAEGCMKGRGLRTDTE